VLDELSDAAARYDIQITVSGGQLTRERTEGRMRAERSRASAWLAGTGAPGISIRCPSSRKPPVGRPPPAGSGAAWPCAI
jgi:hypothetical protein